MDAINISDLSLVDKVFVLMCQNLKIGSVPWNLEHEYNIKINEDDEYNILTKYQCFDIEITIMAKFFCGISLMELVIWKNKLITFRSMVVLICVINMILSKRNDKYV